MTALGDVGTNTEIAPNLGVKVIQAHFDDTIGTAGGGAVGGTDTVTVDLTKFGCTNIHGLLLFDETTTGSVIATQAPTSTAVSAGVLTIDLAGGDTGAKTAIIWAY
ncbi:hypothetical protein LCGC14_1316540 [marine sediment metagenome]|uniref:Uncharacterized protein n=1 Tax=marine sediment metagenome TaxID=412755 RepID=A0A0F9L656_9ZZZZ